MSAGVEKRLIPAAVWAVVGFGMAAFLFGTAFAIAVVRRVGAAEFGWQYHFQSINDYLRLRQPHPPKGLTYDRSWLLLVAASLSGWAVSGLQSFIEWAEKSPEERRSERAYAKEASVKKAQREREERERRKFARKPMSGWRRLWIVLSILFAVPTFLLVYDSYSTAFADIAWNGDNNAFWAAAYSEPALRECDWPTAKAEPAIGTYSMVTCKTNDPFMPALLWSLFPAVLMAAVGLTIRWIYRGFRPGRRSEDA